MDLTDIAPLILDGVGVPAPPMSGASPSARRSGRVPQRRWVRGESFNLGALFARSHRWKVVTAPRRGAGGGRRLLPGLVRSLAEDPPYLFSLGAAGERAVASDEDDPEVVAMVRMLAGIEPPAAEGGDTLASELAGSSAVEGRR